MQSSSEKKIVLIVGLIVFLFSLTCLTYTNWLYLTYLTGCIPVFTGGEISG